MNDSLFKGISFERRHIMLINKSKRDCQGELDTICQYLLIALELSTKLL